MYSLLRVSLQNVRVSQNMCSCTNITTTTTPCGYMVCLCMFWKEGSLFKKFVVDWDDQSLNFFRFLCWFRQPYFSFDFSLSRALASRNMFLCAKFFKWPCNSMVLCVFPFIYLFGRRIRAALFQLRLLCLDRFDTIIDS